MVPKELSEWELWAKRLSTDSLVSKEDFRHAAADIPKQWLPDLGTFYKAAKRERQVQKVNTWLRSLSASGPMGSEERAIRNLVHLFDYLGRFGHDDFLDRSLLTEIPLHPAKPDWSKLPPELEFLAKPAEEMAHVRFASPGALPPQLSDQSKDALIVVAKKIKDAGFPRVKSWYTQLGFAENVEALLVFKLIGVLDALGIRYYE
jgi:hypothetical protein